MPAARAEADHADLPAGVGLGAQEAHPARDVPDDLVIGHAPFAAGAGGEVVRAARPQPRVEVGADRGVAVLGELAHHLAGPLVPAGHVVDHHHAREGAGPERPRVIGLDVVSVVAGDGHALGDHPFVHRATSFLPVVAGIWPLGIYHAGRARGAPSRAAGRQKHSQAGNASAADTGVASRWAAAPGPGYRL